ncbi:MAG: RNA pseudouridine synthase [Ruminococcaceae bacterium]|nr:RNA pseudouridine synthase [Oscillospiraceae bacterium]
MRGNSLEARTADVIFEDESLLVCLKPSGILSCADASGKTSMNDLLLPRKVYPVHRLDREVSGLMLFAKTSQAAAFLSNESGLVKEYLAECAGMPPNEGEWTDLLYHDRIKNKTYVVKRKRNGVKEARLAFRVLEQTQDTAKVLVRLFTGRTHQIRVQFASRGFPLCGDKKYGSKSSGAIGLTSVRLHFTHPNGQRLTFTYPEVTIPE